MTKNYKAEKEAVELEEVQELWRESARRVRAWVSNNAEAGVVPFAGYDKRLTPSTQEREGKAT